MTVRGIWLYFFVENGMFNKDGDMGEGIGKHNRWISM